MPELQAIAHVTNVHRNIATGADTKSELSWCTATQRTLFGAAAHAVHAAGVAHHVQAVVLFEFEAAHGRAGSRIVRAPYV